MNSQMLTTRDGRGLYCRRLGLVDATPTVVFEAGLAGTCSYWAPVQTLVAKWAPTVAYDRSGLGLSVPDSQPRSLTRMAQDLGDVLDQLDGPFVLVGHSWGGLIVRLAAAATPERIKALLLVDPSDEACEWAFRPSVRRAEQVNQVASSLAARLGVLHLAYGSLLDALPEDARAEMRTNAFTTAAMRTRAAELAEVPDGLRMMRDHPPTLPDIPVTVVSGARGMTKTVRAALNKAHRHRAEQSPRGRHVYASESGHMIPTDQPALLAEELRRLVI
ncbi:alpha/beta fold hydrolase [Kutzneria sp. CA-103260]|uniref:alpha/beta fold hydrolase n=1 Tax=Kutzneria sp. CA-103260 TaxID=2802641 RepID=UPI001BAA2CD3|nr:alpha/beta hydrolase [Kutzneria sp. CA-103260]QUQ63776.1 alpha/beta hydrolase [Kutzneria sp. CA-103260]